MAQLEVAASATAQAPAEKVWDLVSDTSRYAEFVEATEQVTRTDGPARSGSSYDEVNKILGPWKARTHWTVTEFEPPRRQVHRGEGLPLTKEFEVVIEVAPAGENASQLTVTLRGTSAGGPLGAAFVALMKPQVDRDNRKSVERFAEAAAREPAA